MTRSLFVVALLFCCYQCATVLLPVNLEAPIIEVSNGAYDCVVAYDGFISGTDIQWTNEEQLPAYRFGGTLGTGSAVNLVAFGINGNGFPAQTNIEEIIPNQYYSYLPRTVSSITFSYSIHVNSIDANVLRYVLTATNSGGTSETVQFQHAILPFVFTDPDPVIFTTSSGDTTFDTDDVWVKTVADYVDVNGPFPAVFHSFGDLPALSYADNEYFAFEAIDAGIDVLIPAGETKSCMFFAVVLAQGDENQIMSDYENMGTLAAAGLMEDMDATEIAQVSNWASAITNPLSSTSWSIYHPFCIQWTISGASGQISILYGDSLEFEKVIADDVDFTTGEYDGAQLYGVLPGDGQIKITVNGQEFLSDIIQIGLPTEGIYSPCAII